MNLARQYFCEGKRYLDELEVLRCKIVAYWYCARYEGVLDTIERDSYILRAQCTRNDINSSLCSKWLGWACMSPSDISLVDAKTRRSGAGGFNGDGRSYARDMPMGAPVAETY